MLKFNNVAAERKGVNMSTYTRQLAKRIREQNEIRDIYKERAQEAQTSYDTAVNTLKNGGDVYSLDDSARAMYRNIQSELAKQQRKEQELLKKEREQMSGIERFGHTLGDFFGQGVGGLMKFGENFVDYFGTMFGADEEWLKRDWTQELYMDKLREGTKGSYLNDGKFGNMVQSSMFGLGNMLPSLALNAVPYVGGALSTASFMVNAAGGSTENALQNGATRDKALLYGTLSGISEGAIEKISGGIGGVGKGIVQSVGKSAGKSAVAKGVLGTAKKYTGRMIGEGLEEVASDVIDPLLKATYTGKVDYSDMTAGSLSETFGVGAMTSGLMLGGQAMAHNATAANRVRTKLGELNEVKAALDKRYYDGKLTEAQYKQGLSDINWLAEKTIKTMNRVSDKKAEKIVGKVGEKRLENAGIVQSDGKFNVNQPNIGAYNYKAMTPSLANKVDSLAYKPTTEELTAEQESLVKDYGKINNGKASIVFTDDIGAVTEDGSKLSANGAYSDGVIYISRTAENPLREVMKHEFTHALEGTKAYGKFASFVIDEIQKSPVLQKEYGDFAQAFIETAEQYKGVTAGDRAVVSEIVAKYSERLFSDPKAINRLARANKGLAMKVLGMVTDRLSALGKGKGTAEMRKFLRRAESLYRKAITAKPSRIIALNGNTANEKDATTNIDENSNIENTVNIDNSTENRSKIETNSQNINENSNITDGNAMSIRTVSDSSGNKVQFSIGKPFAKQIDEIIKGIHDPNLDIYVSKTPDVLINIGFKDKAVLMRNSKVKEILEKHKEMSLDIIKNMPNAIENPLLILKSKSNPNDSVVIIAEINTEKGNLIIPVWMNVEGKYYDIELNKVLEGEYNFIASAYGRNIKTLLEYAINNNEILYFDKSQIKKVNQLFSAHGLQLPAPLNMTNFNNSISNSDANVNNSATESLKNQENDSNIDEYSNIIDGKLKIQYAIKKVDKSKINFEANENTVREMKPVTSIKSNVFQKGNTKLTDMVAQYFRSLGNNVFNTELGDVELNKRGVKDSMAHGIGALKASAFKAVPQVIENGKIVDYQENWKNRSEDTVVLSAPILIDKIQYYMGVILLRDNSHDLQRFYLHEISLNKKEVNPFKTVAATGQTISLHGGLTSNNSISNSETNVNSSAIESLKNNENTANNDENSNNDVKYSLKANKELKKAYTHKDADAMVRGVIKLISDNETVKIRNAKEISDEFYCNINNGMDEGAAAVIVSERIVDEAYTEHYDPTSVERAGDVIEFYNKHIAKKFNLDSINAELKEIFGGNIATVKRVAHNADGLDVAKISEMATAISELGIDIDSKATLAEIFTAIYNEYRDSKEIEKGYKQSVKDSKTAKERNALVQKLAKAMLFAFDKYGSETKLYKRVKELSDTVESLKNYNRTERAKEKSRANIVDEVRLFKELSRRGISAQIIKDSVTDTLIKAISRIVSRKDINVSNLAGATEVLRNFYTEERIGDDYSITHRQYIDELSNELANVDKRTKDLTAHQLNLADKMIKNIRQYIRTAENITREGKNESGRELGQKADDAIRQDEALREKYKVKNVFIKLFRALRGIVDPKCVIGMAEGGRKDGVIGMLYDDIKKAETNQLAMQIEFMEPMDNFFKENKGYAKRLSQSYTIGKTEITFDDAIAILLVSKRAHASATIDGVDYGGVHYAGGGFSYELDNGKTVYIDVSRSDIERIEKSLTELDLEYIDILEEFYNRKARKAKKETDRIIIGSTTVVDGEYYYPISRADEMIAKKFGDSRDLINNVQNYENLSFNKHLVKNARNPIKLRGSLEVFTEYAKLMSAYATMTQALKNFSKVMSINLNAGIPGARIKTLRSTLKETAPFMEKYMDGLLQDIQGTGRQKTSKLLSKMRDGYIKAVLGANVKTWFSQWAGVPAAMTYLSPRDMAKGFAMHVTKEEFIKHSKFGKAHIYNKSAVRSEGIEQKIGSVGDFFMRPIGFSDKWMHIGYWQSCRYAVQRMYGHELGTEANYRMADELYEKVARETQSTNVMSERSAMQRSESEIMRTLTTFASDAQKQLSRIVEGSVSYIYAQMRYKERLITKQELRASRNQLVRSASSFALSNAVYVAIGLLFNALLFKRDEEGKKWGAEDYAKAFGMGMLESYAGLFPIFRDMFNKVASGYDIEHFSYSMINDLVDSTVGVYKLVENRIKGEEVTRMDALKTLRQSLYSVNAFLGMPTKNIAKYAKMIVGWFDEGALYKYNSLFYPAKKSELNAAIEEKKDRLSESIFGVMLTERGFGDMSETAQKKLLELYKAVYKDGISVIPSNVPNKVTWKDSNGAEQEKDLKAADKAVYRANNAKAAKDVEKLLKSGEFSSLSKKEQADAVKKIYAYYNALSKAKVTENEEINTQMLLASLLSVEDMAILSVKNASLVADKYANGKTIPESKKKKLLKLLNTFGLTFAEKELVRVILGYSPSNPKTIKQTIRHSSLTSEEKAYLLSKVV